MMLSPSVWPLAQWRARISSPLTWTVRLWSKVITGRAPLGAGSTLLPATLGLPSARRLRTLSWAMRVEVRPSSSLPPVWSGCQWVLSTHRTGLSVRPLIAAWILGTRGANWSSTTSTPSSPIETAMFPPAPVSM